MKPPAWVDVVFLRTWWRYRPAETPWVTFPYHAFNLFEGTAWVVLSILVLDRYRRKRRSPIELAYALAFFAFGLTDFREAYALDSWLLWLKLLNLIALFRLRWAVIHRFYPESRLY
jgi:hypothetical protein